MKCDTRGERDSPPPGPARTTKPTSHNPQTAGNLQSAAGAPSHTNSKRPSSALPSSFHTTRGVGQHITHSATVNVNQSSSTTRPNTVTKPPPTTANALATSSTDSSAFTNAFSGLKKFCGSGFGISRSEKPISDPQYSAPPQPDLVQPTSGQDHSLDTLKEREAVSRSVAVDKPHVVQEIEPTDARQTISQAQETENPNREDNEEAITYCDTPGSAAAGQEIETPIVQSATKLSAREYTSESADVISKQQVDDAVLQATSELREQIQAQDIEMQQLKMKDRERQKSLVNLQVECEAKDAMITHLTENAKRKDPEDSNDSELPVSKKTKTKLNSGIIAPSMINTGAGYYAYVGTELPGATVDLNGNTYANISDMDRAKNVSPQEESFATAVDHHKNVKIQKQKNFKISTDPATNRKLVGTSRYVNILQNYATTKDALSSNRCFTTSYGGVYPGLRRTYITGYNRDGLFGHEEFTYGGTGMDEKSPDVRDGYVAVYSSEWWRSSFVPFNAILTKGRRVEENAFISLEEKFSAGRSRCAQALARSFHQVSLCFGSCVSSLKSV